MECTKWHLSYNLVAIAAWLSFNELTIYITFPYSLVDYSLLKN